MRSWIIEHSVRGPPETLTRIPAEFGSNQSEQGWSLVLPKVVSAAGHRGGAGRMGARGI
jgi:hypothetical protein